MIDNRPQKLSVLLQDVRAVLFDVDGTLVDSNEAHAQSWVEAFRDAGYSVDPAQVRALIGKGGDKIIPDLVDLHPDSRKAQDLSEARGLIFLTKHLPHVRAFPGAGELLRALARRRFQLVVATSAKADELDKLLQKSGLAELLPLRTTSSDVEDSKPDPDILLAALKKAGVSQEHAIMVGDTPYDLAAAQRAGVRFVGFRSGGWSDEDLAGALAFFDDPAHMLRQLEG